VAYGIRADGEIAFSHRRLGDIEFAHSLEQAKAHFDTHGDGEDAPYADVHSWVFTPSSFALAMLELSALNAIDFTVVRSFPTDGCEFYVTLRRGRIDHSDTNVLQARRLNLHRRTLEELREQAEMLDEREASPTGGVADEDRWFDDPEAISDEGERVSHLVKHFGFYGHLSIYEFAKPFCRDAVVLDAESGAGYGSALLADAGARRVYGIDASAKAVAFSKHHYRQPNLEFEACMLEDLTFPTATLDFIFTSNTLEHVADVPRFLRAAHASLKPTGAMLVAVPPITDELTAYVNVINPYHVNIWSPRQWEVVLRAYFGHVQPFAHGVSENAQALEAGRAGPSALLAEDDFPISPVTLDDLYNVPTLTAIFLATAPHPAADLLRAALPLTFVDESFSRPAGVIPPEVKTRLKPYFDSSPPMLVDEPSSLPVGEYPAVEPSG